MQWVATVYSSRSSRSVDRQLQTPRASSTKPKSRLDLHAAADTAEHTHKDIGASRGDGSDSLRMRQRNVTSDTATERNAAKDIIGGYQGNANRPRIIDSQDATQTSHNQHRRVRGGARSPNYIDTVARQQVYGAEWPLRQQPELEQSRNMILREPRSPVASLRGAVLDAGSPSLLLSLSARTIARLAKLHPAGGGVLVDALLAQARCHRPRPQTSLTRRSSSKPTDDGAHRHGSARLLKTSLDTLRDQPVAIDAKLPLAVGR
jgi:hypothetical protein